MFSKTCEYAIRAMIFVAIESDREKKYISPKAISDGIEAPLHFTAKILQELVRKGLMKSIKGPNGGFFVDESKLKTPLSEVVIIFDGHKIYNECVLGLKSCSEKSPCPVHFEYKEVKRNFIQIIENNTIEDFQKKLNSKNYFLKNNNI